MKKLYLKKQLKKGMQFFYNIKNLLKKIIKLKIIKSKCQNLISLEFDLAFGINYSLISNQLQIVGDGE